MIRVLPLLVLAITSANLAAGCHTPEAYYRNVGGVSGSGGNGALGGQGGAGGAGGGIGSGGDGAGGTVLSTGGAATGGTLGGGTGGEGTGGEGTGGAGSGGSGTGGAAGATGGTASGGATAGAGGMRATGGNAGGTAGGAGGAATGGTGVGGNTGTDPCLSLCSGAISVAINTNSGALGTKATCHEVAGTVNGIVCGNFVSTRTFKVNGTTVPCTGSGVPIPAKRNGGYCMQASPGDYSYAYFSTY